MDESHRNVGAVGVTLFVVIATAACVEESSSVDVVVCGDLNSGRDVTEIRVSILDADREFLQATVIPMVDCDREVAYDMPRRTTFVDVTGEVWVVAQGLHDGIETVRGETRAVVDDDLVGVEIVRDCIGVKCAPGQACVRGSCRTLTLGQNPNICGDDGEERNTSTYQCTGPGADRGAM